MNWTQHRSQTSSLALPSATKHPNRCVRCNERGGICGPNFPHCHFMVSLPSYGMDRTHMCTAMKDSFVISIIWESLRKGYPLLASLSFKLPAVKWTSKMWQYDWADQVLKFIIHVSSFSSVLMRSHLKLCDVPSQFMKKSHPPACRIPMILEACSSLNIFIILRNKNWYIHQVTVNTYQRNQAAKLLLSPEISS